MKSHARVVCLLVGFGFTSAATAADIDVSQGLLQINTEAGGEVSLSVSGPGGYHIQISEGNSVLQSGVMALSDLGIFVDGSYTWEVTEVSYGGRETVSDPANGREGVTRRIVNYISKVSGHFTVLNGSIVSNVDLAE